MAYRLSQDEIKVTSILGRKLSTPTLDVLHPSHFAYRHIGPRRADVEEMLDLLGYPSLESFIDAVVPEEIRLRRPLALPPGRSEREVLQALRGLAGMNRVFRSYIGMGYAGCFTPQVIQRNVLENPGWYTAYTPYQAEIAQGRLEALLNFQTVVSDLTGLEVANASLLDEATAAAEAMNLSLAVHGSKGEPAYLVDERCHPQTIAVVRTRAEARGINVLVADPATFNFKAEVIGALASRGLVTVRHGRRMEIRPVSAWNHLDPLLLELNHDPEGVRKTLGDLHDLRMLLEPEIAARAALMATDEQFERMRRDVERMEELEGDPDAYLEIDVDFHSEIASATGNVVLAFVLDSVRELLRVSRRVTNLINAMSETTVAHRRIYDALRAREPETARQAMRAHLLTVTEVWTRPVALKRGGHLSRRAGE